MLRFEVTPDTNWLQLVECDNDIDMKQLRISMRPPAKNYFFHPKYKQKTASGARIWDGTINFLYKDSAVQIGLWGELLKMAKRYDIDLKIDGLERVVDVDAKCEDVVAWCDEFYKDRKIVPGANGREYQIESICDIIKYRYSTQELATNAGKTLIVFSTFAYMLDRGLAKKCLMIVPNTNLVMQGHDDFVEYGAMKAHMMVRMFHGESKNIDGANCVVGTYQSLVKQGPEFFRGFDAVCVDECLHPDSIIDMADGSKKRIADVKADELVKTVNEETGKIEGKEVEFVYENLSKGNQMYELELENGKTLRITGNHKVKLSTGEWKRVDELAASDEIIYHGIDRSIKKVEYEGDVYNLRVKDNHNYFADGVLVSNCHSTDTMSIKKILSLCTNAKFRFGLSGTIKEERTANNFTIQAYLGPVTKKVTPDFLFRKKVASPVEVKVVRLSYLPMEARERLAKLASTMDGKEIYQIEKKLVINSRLRLNFVCDFIAKTTKNSLVLYSSVEDGYGIRLYDRIREVSQKEVYLVDGNTAPNLREEYKDRMKTGDNRVLVATYKTFGTGISINNLHNLFFTESYKAETLIKQTIGRGMRLHEDKDKVTIVDFVDDFSITKPNFMMKHSAERLDIYRREGFAHKVYDVKIGE